VNLEERTLRIIPLDSGNDDRYVAIALDIMKRKRLAVDFIELHLLHHASEDEVYGFWMLEELAHHGYRLNASQLYPRFSRLERAGVLKHRRVVVNGKVRKYYRVTPRGKRYLAERKRRLIELVSEALSAEELRRAMNKGKR
jgi:DNA-binding PadR family transcriptional regulator